MLHKHPAEVGGQDNIFLGTVHYSCRGRGGICWKDPNSFKPSHPGHVNRKWPPFFTWYFREDPASPPRHHTSLLIYLILIKFVSFNHKMITLHNKIGVLCRPATSFLSTSWCLLSIPVFLITKSFFSNARNYFLNLEK